MWIFWGVIFQFCKRNVTRRLWSGEKFPSEQFLNFRKFHIIESRKTLTTFHYTGWLIGNLIMVYYNPYITGYYNPLNTLTNQGFFHCSIWTTWNLENQASLLLTNSTLPTNEGFGTKTTAMNIGEREVWKIGNICPNYHWWKISCTTWDVKKTENNSWDKLPTSTGAKFLPSTVPLKSPCAIKQ